MTNTTGDEWSASIPAQPLQTTVYYYIEGIASNGKQGAHPFPAPLGSHVFDVIDPGTVSLNEGASIQLNEIYPNPANAITVIPISSTRQQQVKIKLFNLQGSLVKEIYKGEISAGEKNFFINASKYPSGLYQVIIETEEYEQIQKLVIE